MASVNSLLFISLVLFFCSHYEEVGAVRQRRSRRQIQLKDLKFSQIISGQSLCRLEDMLGKRLYSERRELWCDLRVTVIDNSRRDDGYSWQRSPNQQGGARQDYPSRASPLYDNSSLATAVDVTRQDFCVHRAVMYARSKYLGNLIEDSLVREGLSSNSLRTMRITVYSVPPTIFEYILEYIYTYQISNMDPNLIIDLYVGAYILQIDDLRNSIVDYILTDVPNSVEQIHKIREWIEWAQRNQRYDLQLSLLRGMKKVLRMNRDEEEWRKFGQFMCSITTVLYEQRVRESVMKMPDRTFDREFGWRPRYPGQRYDGTSDRMPGTLPSDRVTPIIKK